MEDTSLRTLYSFRYIHLITMNVIYVYTHGTYVYTNQAGVDGGDVVEFEADLS